MSNAISLLSLLAFNSYNEGKFWRKVFDNTASNSDCFTEILNITINSSNMNCYDKELCKAFCSSCNYLFCGVN